MHGALLPQKCFWFCTHCSVGALPVGIFSSPKMGGGDDKHNLIFDFVSYKLLLFVRRPPKTDLPIPWGLSSQGATFVSIVEPVLASEPRTQTQANSQSQNWIFVTKLGFVIDCRFMFPSAFCVRLLKLLTQHGSGKWRTHCNASCFPGRARSVRKGLGMESGAPDESRSGPRGGLDSLGITRPCCL